MNGDRKWAIAEAACWIAAIAAVVNLAIVILSITKVI